MSYIPLRPSKAPSIPLAPEDYDRGFVDQVNSALRLYFAQVDNAWSAVLENTGGNYIGLPHVAAQHNLDQYATGNNIPTKVLWNTLDSANGFTLNANNSATAQESGVYKIDYSLQFVNTANESHTAAVWLKIDGVDVPGSSSVFTLPARKSVSIFSYLVAYSSVTFQTNGGSDIELWWATDQAYNLVGPVNGIYMEHLAAQTVPYVRPSNPSAIGSITFVSRLPSQA